MTGERSGVRWMRTYWIDCMRETFGAPTTTTMSDDRNLLFGRCAKSQGRADLSANQRRRNLITVRLKFVARNLEVGHLHHHRKDSGGQQ